MWPINTLATVQLALDGGEAEFRGAVVVCRPGHPVKVHGLVAQPWTMQDRSGVAFRAARLIAGPLNRLIAWADLNLQLYPRQGAERAVHLDPKLRTGLGRQGARWFATNGTPRERLRYAASLVRQDRRELPLLRAAVAKGLCSRDPRIRRAAVAAAAQGRLPLKRLTRAARAC